jgi:hypothetical protein
MCCDSTPNHLQPAKQELVAGLLFGGDCRDAIKHGSTFNKAL